MRSEEVIEISPNTTSKDDLSAMILEYATNKSKFDKIKRCLSDWEAKYLDQDIKKYPQHLQKFAYEVKEFIEKSEKSLQDCQNNKESLAVYCIKESIESVIESIQEAIKFSKDNYAELCFYVGLSYYAFHADSTVDIIYYFDEARLYADRLHPIENYFLLSALGALYAKLNPKKQSREIVKKRKEQAAVYAQEYAIVKKKYENDDRKYITDLIHYGTFFYKRGHLVFAYYFYQCATNHVKKIKDTTIFKTLSWEDRFQMLQAFRCAAYCNFYPIVEDVKKCENTKMIQVMDSVFQFAEVKIITAYSMTLWILIPESIFTEEVIERQYRANVQKIRADGEKIFLERELLRTAFKLYHLYIGEIEKIHSDFTNGQDLNSKNFLDSILQFILYFFPSFKKVKEYYVNVIATIMTVVDITPDVQRFITERKIPPLTDRGQLNAMQRVIEIYGELTRFLDLFFRFVELFDVKRSVEKDPKLISYDFSKLRDCTLKKEDSSERIEELILTYPHLQVNRIEITEQVASLSKRATAIERKLKTNAEENAEDLLEIVRKEKEKNAKKLKETRKSINDKLQKKLNNPKTSAENKVEKPSEKAGTLLHGSESIESKPSKPPGVNKNNPNDLPEKYLNQWQKAYNIYLAAKKSNRGVIAFFQGAIGDAIVKGETFQKSNDEMISLFQNIITAAKKDNDHLTVCKVSCLAADMLTHLVQKYFFGSRRSQNTHDQLPFTKEIVLHAQYLLNEVLKLRKIFLASMRELRQSDEFSSYYASVQLTHEYTENVVDNIYKVIDKFHQEQRRIFAEILERNKRQGVSRKNKQSHRENPYRTLRQFIELNHMEKQKIIDNTKKIKQEIEVLDDLCKSNDLSIESNKSLGL